MGKKYYLTTAIPYVNARPHIGHALEYAIADAIHRYLELTGHDVYLVSGADENALKNVQASEKEGVPVSRFLEKYAKIFQEFYQLLGVSLDEFRRGSDQKKHWPGVQKLWKLAEKKGDIYKKKYKGLYCVACEAFKTEKDLARGKCPDHNIEPVEVEEENYFFRLGKYQDQLQKLIQADKYKIYPQKRKNEVLSFIKAGLEDFSISRSNERARGVGVPVPGDDTQKVYVWFDALTIYMTGVGWGYDETLWKKWWPADLHIIGKDIIRFHAVYWPAMLLSAGLPLPKRLLVHGFITSGGQKMSKTVGNVIDPYQVIDNYGVEALRYYLLSQIPTLDDGDFTLERFKEVYNASLANNLGNLVSRVARLCEQINLSVPPDKKREFHKFVADFLNEFKLNLALEAIWERISGLNRQIDQEKPWENPEKKKEFLLLWVEEIRQIAYDLRPFLPETAEKIEKQFAGPKISSGKPLFPRIT